MNKRKKRHITYLLKAGANPWVKGIVRVKMHSMLLLKLVIYLLRVWCCKIMQMIKNGSNKSLVKDPLLINLAQSNNHHGCATLLCNFNRCNDPLFKRLCLVIYRSSMELIDSRFVVDQDVKTDFCVPCSPLTWATHLDDEALVEKLLHKERCKFAGRNKMGLNAWQWAENLP